MGKLYGYNKAFLPLLLGFILITGITSTQAATQGKMGSTSTASMVIRLIIHPNVRTSIAETFQDDKHTVTKARINQKEPLCIKGTGMDHYKVTANGSGPEGQFIIKENERKLAYNVNIWNGSNKLDTLSHGQPGRTLRTSKLNSKCDDNRTSFSVDMPAKQFFKTALGTLGLTISAE
ncbi:hypothetical protein [Endozoicomonas sp. OPT23]|uniref:hypothetical protein n=1 Tax=Endozoicomonas sp. OPT23 TaxID=2072845 RepID=UPI00129ABD02|nr:hypothetical protein [Endozoicomonas sp. OPT23]